MIYSLLSQSNGNTGIYQPWEFKKYYKETRASGLVYQIFKLPRVINPVFPLDRLINSISVCFVISYFL